MYSGLNKQVTTSVNRRLAEGPVACFLFWLIPSKEPVSENYAARELLTLKNSQVKYNQIDLEVLYEIPYSVSSASGVRTNREWL